MQNTLSRDGRIRMITQMRSHSFLQKWKSSYVHVCNVQIKVKRGKSYSFGGLEEGHY